MDKSTRDLIRWSEELGRRSEIAQEHSLAAEIEFRRVLDQTKPPKPDADQLQPDSEEPAEPSS